MKSRIICHWNNFMWYIYSIWFLCELNSKNTQNGFCHEVKIAGPVWVRALFWKCSSWLTRTQWGCVPSRGSLDLTLKGSVECSVAYLVLNQIMLQKTLNCLDMRKYLLMSDMFAIWSGIKWFLKNYLIIFEPSSQKFVGSFFDKTPKELEKPGSSSEEREIFSENQICGRTQLLTSNYQE